MGRRTPKPEWAAIDVDLLHDDKVAQLTPADQVAYLSSILWTTKHLTDGRIPATALPVTGATRRQAGRFVELGLWHALDDGWQLSAWDRWQKPRAEWERTLEHRRHAARLGNCQRWHEEWCQCLTGAVPVPKKRSHK